VNLEDGSKSAISENAENDLLQGSARFDPGLASQAAPNPKLTVQQLEKRRTLHTGWVLAVQSLALSIVIALFVITFLVQAFQIPSESMENTLQIGDYLLVDKVHFALRGRLGDLLPYTTPKRGEIMVFRYPLNPAQYFVKRLIAVPGDRVRITNRRVWVNDKPVVDEHYTIYQSRYSNAYADNFPPPTDKAAGSIPPAWTAELRQETRGDEVVVPANEYFVLGDNREDSADSRYWGFVPRENIVGRPLLIYFSVRRRSFPAADPSDGKLISFALSVEHFWNEIRWKRIFKLVR
jgi:signal peptidase I